MYFKLLKVYFKDFSIDRVLQINGGKGKKIALMAALIYGLVAILGGLGFMFFNLADILNQGGQIHVMVSFLAMYSLTLPIMMTLFRASGTLFFYKDYDIVAPLPIKSRTIFSAKLTMMLGWMYAMNLILVLPMLFSYFYFLGFDFVGLIIYLIVSIIFPLIPIAVMTIFSLGIGYLATKFSFGKILQIILLFGVFIGIMLLQFNINSTTVNPLTGQIDVVAGLKDYYPLIGWFEDAVYNHDLLSLLYLVLSHLGFFVLFIFGVEKLSTKINQHGITKHVIHKVKQNKIAQQSVTRILIRKEFNKFFSIPIYALNAGFGIVLLAILAIASQFYDISDILSSFEMANIQPSTGITIIIGFVIALAYTPAITLSLEGKNFWILKSLPIKAEKVMFSKVYFNIILVLPVLIISIILFGISLQMTFIEVILMMLVSSTLLALVSCADAVVNLYFPKMHYKNDVEIVKQSLSAIIGMLAGFLLVVINGGIFYLLDHSFGLGSKLIFLLLSIMNVLLIIPFYDIIKRKSEAIFKNL